MDDIKWFKWLLWGCTQMVCGLLCILCGILLAVWGFFAYSMTLLAIGGIAGLMGLIFLANGFFAWVRPALRENSDNK